MLDTLSAKRSLEFYTEFRDSVWSTDLSFICIMLIVSVSLVETLNKYDPTCGLTERHKLRIRHNFKERQE